jgi:hypothetical protein
MHPVNRHEQHVFDRSVAGAVIGRVRPRRGWRQANRQQTKPANQSRDRLGRQSPFRFHSILSEFVEVVFLEVIYVSIAPSPRSRGGIIHPDTMAM